MQFKYSPQRKLNSTSNLFMFCHLRSGIKLLHQFLFLNISLYTIHAQIYIYIYKKNSSHSRGSRRKTFLLWHLSRLAVMGDAPKFNTLLCGAELLLLLQEKMTHLSSNLVSHILILFGMGSLGHFSRRPQFMAEAIDLGQ